MDVNNHMEEMRKMEARLKRLEYALGLSPDCEAPNRSDMLPLAWPDMDRVPFLHPVLVGQVCDRIEPILATRIGAQLQPQPQQQLTPGTGAPEGTGTA